MELERDEHIGAARYELTEARQTSRDGQFYPSIFERYQHSEKALTAALAEAFVQGVSTRRWPE